jgi:hypothetical protein
MKKIVFPFIVSGVASITGFTHHYQKRLFQKEVSGIAT